MPFTTDTSGAKFQALSVDEYSIPKAQIFFKPDGTEYFRLLGDADDVTLDIKVSETERFTNESGIQELATTIVTKIDAELGLTLVQLNDLNRAIALLGDLTYDTQGATSGTADTIEDAVFDSVIYALSHRSIDLSTVVVTDSTLAVIYDLDIDYKIDAAGGYIQLLKKHAGSDTDVVVTYDAQAVTTDEKAALIGVGAKTSNRGELVVRGTNEVGARVELHLWDVQLRPNGKRNYVSESDLAKVEIIGRVFRDSTQAAGQELGTERKII